MPALAFRLLSFELSAKSKALLYPQCLAAACALESRNTKSK